MSAHFIVLPYISISSCGCEYTRKMKNLESCIKIVDSRKCIYNKGAIVKWSFGSGHNPKYTLSHSGARRVEVLRFDNDAQTHREQYKDHTGTYPRVPSFVHRRIASAPTTRFDLWLALAGAHSFHEHLLPLVSTYDRSLLYSNRARANNGLVYTRKTNALERATRDQFFQRR